ncbi:hypothetical protein BSLG_006395 [Batrachochytrium salamandrivorans]|nr:hypothetical protein BSLG_006395 [Batrachochytrium salamandrivorans]
MSDVWDAAAASAAAAAAAASTSPTASLTNTTTETLDSSYTTTTTTGGDCIHHHHHRALTHNSPPMSAALTTTTNIPSTGSSPALLSASASAPALAPTPLLMPSFKLSKRNQVKKACGKHRTHRSISNLLYSVMSMTWCPVPVFVPGLSVTRGEERERVSLSHKSDLLKTDMSCGLQPPLISCVSELLLTALGASRRLALVFGVYWRGGDG